jgi:hypothetical protein
VGVGAAPGGAPPDPSAVAETPAAADAPTVDDQPVDDELEDDEAQVVHLAVTEVVAVGDGPGLEPLARLLLDIAAALGMHPHVVDYQPRAGGFVVPRELAEAYAAHTAETGDHGPVEAPKGSRQKRAATVKPPVARKATGRKAAAKKEGGDGDGR